MMPLSLPIMRAPIWPMQWLRARRRRKEAQRGPWATSPSKQDRNRVDQRRRQRPSAAKSARYLEYDAAAMMRMAHRDRGHQHGEAARLPELERCGGVLVHEGRLHRGFVRRMLFDHAPQAVVDGEEARGEPRLLVGRKRPASEEAQPVAGERHHAPTGATKPGIDAEDPNQVAHDRPLIAPPAATA